MDPIVEVRCTSWTRSSKHWVGSSSLLRRLTTLEPRKIMPSVSPGTDHKGSYQVTYMYHVLFWMNRNSPKRCHACRLICIKHHHHHHWYGIFRTEAHAARSIRSTRQKHMSSQKHSLVKIVLKSCFPCPIPRVRAGAVWRCFARPKTMVDQRSRSISWGSVATSNAQEYKAFSRPPAKRGQKDQLNIPLSYSSEGQKSRITR